MTLPVIAVNAFVVAVVGPFTGSIGSGEGTRTRVYFWQATWAFLTLYSALLVAYLCEPSVLSFIGTAAAHRRRVWRHHSMDHAFPRAARLLTLGRTDGPPAPCHQ